MLLHLLWVCIGDKERPGQPGGVRLAGAFRLPHVVYRTTGIDALNTLSPMVSQLSLLQLCRLRAESNTYRPLRLAASRVWWQWRSSSAHGMFEAREA